MSDEQDLFFGTSGPKDADIILVGEAFGVEEDRRKIPFVGESGRELDRMLGEAGFKRDNIFATNIIPERPPANKLFKFFNSRSEAKEKGQAPTRGLHPTTKITNGLKNLYAQVRHVKPKIIVGLGNYPLWAFTSNAKIDNSKRPDLGWKIPTGITNYRGSQLITEPFCEVGEIPFLPTIHPAAVLRSWEVRKYVIHDLRVRINKALKNDWRQGDRNYRILQNADELEQTLKPLLTRANAGELVPVGCDIETYMGGIACIGLGWSTSDAICLPYLSERLSVTERVRCVKLLRDFLSHPNIFVIGQNFLFDIQYIRRWMLFRPNYNHELMAAQNVLFPGTPKSLWFMASLFCEFYRYWKDDVKEWDPKEQSYEEEMLYNCDDVCYTFEIWQEQVELLSKLNLTEQFEWKMRACGLAINMMRRGVKIDKEERLRQLLALDSEATPRQDFLDRVMPPSIIPEMKSKNASKWYNSPIQKAMIFYDRLGMVKVYHRKTGQQTMDAEAIKLHKLRYGYLTRVFDAMLDLGSLAVFKQNFLTKSLDFDGRMRCLFSPYMVETHRWNSKENVFGRGTNLQNIPKGDEEDEEEIVI